MKTNAAHSNTVQEIKQDGKQAAREAAFNPLVENIARIGFAARGLIYFMMGIVALQVALGGRSAPADQQGAVAAIARQPFGSVLLVFIMVGLVGYSLWGLIRAIFDPLHKGNDLKGIVQRLGYLFSAVTYALLIPPAYGAWTGGRKAARTGAQTAQSQQVAAALMAAPWGKWAVMAAGVIGIAGGLYQVFSAFRPKFEQQYQAYSLDKQQRYWINRIGRFGTAARGFVFALVGMFLVLAAYHTNPHEVRGFDGALMALARQPYGPFFLGIVAVGLVAFGVYSALGALWFRERR